MKKLLYLFITATILISCDSDNDSDLEPIIGKWQLTSETENGKEISDECQRKSTITFFENGTTSEIYYYNYGNDVCESDTTSSKWENVGDSNYRITNDGNSETNEILFSNNNNVFSFTFSEEHNGITYTYKGIYKRI
ncbi:lipocalin family protein [uncultured Polaribacter sp.]|uniref:lipocalin family protein n=1 Tax=uncultured Polaribacter sp. TaxID=174711 RepID=UPI00262D6696|nr:lipocalin family protein [uncultured Polaribacter sp.]